MPTLFNTFSHFFIILAMATLFNHEIMADEVDKASTWQQIRSLHFGQRPIRDNATDLLFIEAPIKIEDAAVIPLTIKSLAAQTPENNIKTLHLIVDNNPQPYSAVFHLNPKLGSLAISTRIRMDNYSHVRVIAEMNDNSLHMVKQFIIASGGCSAPANKDSSASLARLGKIQIRMRKPTLGQQTTSHVIISHPNNTGLQFDPVSQDYIPAHYVTNINISYNNTSLIIAETGITLSENPSIRFKFTPSSFGILKAKITDSNKNSYEHQVTINAE